MFMRLSSVFYVNEPIAPILRDRHHLLPDKTKNCLSRGHIVDPTLSQPTDRVYLPESVKAEQAVQFSVFPNMLALFRVPSLPKT